MEKNEINRKCLYYNSGGDGTEERPFYPSYLGARCEYYDDFFSIDASGTLNPNCYQCIKDLELLLSIIV